MKKILNVRLLLFGIFVLPLSSCFQSTPESPQQAVEEIQSQLSLAGTAWELESFGEPEDELPVLPDTRLTVNYFVERYAGFGGCNWYLGVYTTNGSELRMQTPATTSDICEPAGLMAQEGTFMSSLLNITEYKMEGDQLVGYTVENQRLLTFNPSRLAPFEGTTWELKLMFDGKELVPLISGSLVTAQFEDDQMSGSAGCNNYTATIELDGDKLTIGPAASTQMACADPEGAMDQEIEYLTKLSSVAGFGQVGGALALLDADGQVILMFGAQ